MSTDLPTRSYRPGDWFGILGEHAIVLLPPTEKGRVAEIWSMVDEGAGFEEVLDVLISSGLRDLPSFALVSTHGDHTRVLLRGEVHASFTADDDTVELAGDSSATWVERSLDSVSALTLSVGPETPSDTDGADLLIDGGLVRVAAVSQPASSLETAGAHAADRADPAVAVPAEGPLPDPVERITDAEEPEDAEPEPPAPAPSGTDPDDLTVAGGWEAVDDRPDVPGRPPAPPVTRPVARLVFSSGENVEVDRPVLVGRAPEARRSSSGDQPRLVAVPSPQQEVSSTHLEIRPGTGADQGTAVVTDLGSTNGTVLVQPGLPPEDLQPGVAIQLVPGAIIDLGDGVTIQVVNA